MNRKMLFVSGVAVVTILIVLSTTLFLKNQSGTVSLNVYPADTSYSIAGKSYRGTVSEIAIKTGSYRITFRSKGFKDLEKEISIPGGKKTTYEILLEPKAPSSLNGYNQPFLSLSEADKIQVIDDAASDQGAANFLKAYPLVLSLPYSTALYSIDYQTSGEGNTLTIISIILGGGKTKEEIVNEAISWIKQQNVDPNSLRIQYNILQPTTNE